MAKQVSASVTVGLQSFPLGTVDTLYGYVVTNGAGEPVASLDSAELSATFTLDAGDYTVTVTKNGVSASTNFTVAADDVQLNVPVSVTVSIV